MPVDKAKLDALDKLGIDSKLINCKILLYGQPGTTKTTLGASVGDRILFLVADPDGWQSTLNHPELGLGTRIELMRYAGISQLETLADVFVQGGTKWDVFDTIQIDTMSNVASLDRDVVTKQKIKQKGGEENFLWEDQQWPIYNQNTLRVTSALLKLMLAPINVVMTAHVTEKEDKRTGRLLTRPKFSPEIFASISGQCSMIAYMTANDAGVDSDGTVDYKRKIQYHPTSSIVAKTRIGGLPVSEDLIVDKNDVLHSRLREIVENWKAKGGALISAAEAEEVSPDELGVTTPAALLATDEEPEPTLQSFDL